MAKPLRYIAAVVVWLAVAAPLGAWDDGYDQQSGKYQEYFSQLMEEWQVDQMREMARQWGISFVGAGGVRMNRRFWEERLNLALWLPRSNRGQNLVLEYYLRPRFLVRGELDRHSRENSAWLDFIFRAEY